VALVPARAGSKSIPKKNIAPLAGHPLLYWAVRACAQSGRVDRTFVSSDSAEIRAVVSGLALPVVEAVDRGPETATDTASTESVMLEFAEQHAFQHMLLVQATSPLLRPGDVRGAIDAYLGSGADSLLSVVRTKRFFWRQRKDGFVEPVNYDPQNRPRRQDWAGQLVENGAMYLTSRERLLETRCRLSGRTLAYEMPEQTYYELDEPSDWRIVEQLLQAPAADRGPVAEAARRLRLLCVDVDGTLTDAGMYYSGDGEALKKFNTRDAMGLSLVRDLGIEVALVTTEETPIVAARARKLRIEEAHVGVKDKVGLLTRLLERRGCTWSETGFVGDDLNDLPALQKAGFSACPADAAGEVRQAVQYVCARPGGHGAVREVCDLIRSHRPPSAE